MLVIKHEEQEYFEDRAVAKQVMHEAIEAGDFKFEELEILQLWKGAL